MDARIKSAHDIGVVPATLAIDNMTHLATTIE
jgi:hypothetical protein